MTTDIQEAHPHEERIGKAEFIKLSLPAGKLIRA